jgi:hypothetical protein
MRTLVCAAAALLLFAGVGLAAKKKGKTYTGEVVSVDAEKGTLKVLVKGKKGTEPTEMEFTEISETTPVVAYVGEETTALTGKDVLKKEQFKKGAKITVVTDADNKVTQISFGKKKKAK